MSPCWAQPSSLPHAVADRDMIEGLLHDERSCSGLLRAGRSVPDPLDNAALARKSWKRQISQCKEDFECALQQLLRASGRHDGNLAQEDLCKPSWVIWLEQAWSPVAW
jgi:hypothetical protein